MARALVCVCALICAAAAASVPPIGTQPEQVHISYPGVKNSMVVTWSTSNRTESVVEYSLWGDALFRKKAKGNYTVFTDGGTEKRTSYIHRVTLTDLRHGSAYVYHCGSDDGWSDVFYLTSLNESLSFGPRFALYGDMGNENPQSLSRLQKETQIGMYDAVLHIGDFAYDMHEDNGRIGDEFMKQIESIAAYVPYMTCPGNHESAYNFSQYRYRFSMPGHTENLWYSWNIGPAHIISFSTEVYFYLEYGLDLLFRQYEWLKKDLEEANRPEQRAERPWIITMAHRPMYCSDDDRDDCTRFQSYVRRGRNDTTPIAPGLEDLFYKYGVDLELWAHEHTYERLWPVYDYKVYNGSFEEPYVNPKAPVHIITGSAGCREKHDAFIPKPRSWSAFRSTDYGYTRMHLINSTHLYLEQVSDDQYGKVIDDIMLVKETHGPDAWL
ncbi:Acid phosphatase type 7 [Triplophysa tibetana]|uniref:Purple acid phosphatase n=1 Tax=Triplophysa tibetana TaxID=1572043 RepID=A0A5A9NRA7_9TELE|nr:Acid phosphatase type 7 [Triplophysa tibetana]